MPYVAKTLIAHYQYTCQEGKPCNNCPPRLLAQFIKDGLVTFVGVPDEPIPGFEDVDDPLSSLTRPELLQVVKSNQLTNFFTPMKSWSDEQIRTAIREVTPSLGKLTMPSAAPPAVILTPEEPETV